MWSEWAMLVIIPGIGSRSQAMNAGGQDINQTLEFRTATAMARLLPTGLLLIFLGLSIFVLADADIKRIGTLVAVCLVAGSAVVVVALWRRINHGKPLFTLSPEGIHYRIPWVKAFNIPWSEIQAVDTVDIEIGYWSILDRRTLISIPDYYEVTYYNVTVVLVSKQFYDARMSVASFWLRGPVWKAVFLPRGELVQVALHHELVSVAPRLLREAVEARWLAFRDQPARTSVPGAGVMKLEAEQQELRRQLDEDMRRVFGR
jgi:multidrug transporter EmrE-like cation transporter